MTDDLIGRAEAQTAIQFAARRYTVAHEAHGEGQVVWSDNLINVTDAMNVLRDLPSAEQDTTTHDSIPAETGKNDGDGTSGDCISRQQAIEAIHEDADWLAAQGSDWQVERIERDKSILKSLPSVQPETNCSEIPNNSDTISRQAVTKFLNDWLSCLFENCHKQSASDLKMIIKDFKNLPSAQPELKKLSEWKADFKGYINALNIPKDDYDGIMEYIDEVPSAQPERKAVFNRDIAIEAICDEVMLWFDVSATKAYEIAETAVKRIEVRMEKRGEQDG